MYTEDIRERLFVEVCNAKKNRDMLQNVVYEPREDLAVVYRLSGYDEATGRDCELVTKEQLKQWGIDYETLKADAWENTMTKRPPILLELEDACNSDFTRNHMKNEEPVPRGLFPELDLFVLTNELTDNGAIYIFNDETMQRLAEKMGGNLIVMPASVHETIVYTEGIGLDVGKASDMVGSINQMMIESDILSNEIYRYDKDMHSLTMIQGLEQKAMPLPDKITINEMHDYGYTWSGMLPLSKERAMELAESGVEVFRLYENGAEGMVMSSEEFSDYDGMYGVEQEEWNRYLNTQNQENVDGMTQQM